MSCQRTMKVPSDWFTLVTWVNSSTAVARFVRKFSNVRDTRIYPTVCPHRGTKGILLFFQQTRTLQSRGVVTLLHLFTIAIYGRNCFDMQH